MNTNWPDVAVALIFGVTLISALAIGGWLVIKDHPWFGFFILLIAASLRMKTGS